MRYVIEIKTDNWGYEPLLQVTGIELSYSNKKTALKEFNRLASTIYSNNDLRLVQVDRQTIRWSVEVNGNVMNERLMKS